MVGCHIFWLESFDHVKVGHFSVVNFDPLALSRSAILIRWIKPIKLYTSLVMSICCVYGAKKKQSSLLFSI